MTPFHTTIGTEITNQPTTHMAVLHYPTELSVFGNGTDLALGGCCCLLCGICRSSTASSGMTSAFNSYLSYVCICIALQAVLKQSRVVRLDQVALHTKGGQQAAVQGLVRQGFFSHVTVGPRLPNVMHHDNCTVVLNATLA